MHKRRMNAGQRTAFGENIPHDGPNLPPSILRRFVLRKLHRIANDRQPVADRGQDDQCLIQQSSPTHWEKSLVYTHARTLASRENKSYARRFELCHMKKHKANAGIHESNLFRKRKPSEDEGVRFAREHYSPSCRKNSWTFLCWDDVRTNFPGRAALLTESTTKSAWCARLLINMTGKPCAAAIASKDRRQRLQPCAAAPAKNSLPGCPERGACARSFRFGTGEKISAPGTKVG